MSFVNFLRLHSNSKAVFILPLRNKYSNLKTTCHIKPQFLLCTKILVDLLLAEYLISVAVALEKFLSQSFHIIWVQGNSPKSRKFNQRASQIPGKQWVMGNTVFTRVSARGAHLIVSSQRGGALIRGRRSFEGGAH